MSELFTKEIWKWITGFKGRYEISNKLNIKSVERIVYKENNRWGGSSKCHHKEKILKQTDRGDGRLIVGLCKNGVSKNYYVCRLYLETFVGLCPEGMECCHRDDDPQNNSPDNIYWGTHIQNCEDGRRNGVYLNQSKGENHCRAKLTEKIVKRVRKESKEGKTTLAISRELGVTPTCVFKIIHRITWKHVA